MVMRGFCVSNATKMMVRSQWEDDVWLTVYANCARPRMNQYLSMLRQLIRVPSFFLSVAHAKLWNSTIICLCMKKELNIYFSSNQIAIQNFFLSHSKSHSFYSSLLFANKCCSSLPSMQMQRRMCGVITNRFLNEAPIRFSFVSLFRFFFIIPCPTHRICWVTVRYTQVYSYWLQ